MYIKDVDINQICLPILHNGNMFNFYEYTDWNANRSIPSPIMPLLFSYIEPHLAHIGRSNIITWNVCYVHLIVKVHGQISSQEVWCESLRLLIFPWTKSKMEPRLGCAKNIVRVVPILKACSVLTFVFDNIIIIGCLHRWLCIVITINS